MQKKKVAILGGLGLVLAVTVILISINMLHLQQNEIRQELGYTPVQYQRLLGMVESDITSLEMEPEFGMPVWENHTPYRALLADSSTVYIVLNDDDNSVSCILDKDYDLLFGMIEQGHA